MPRDRRVVVLGCGVNGLTTALVLAPTCSVTIVAQHLPGDEDINYTSPWAGANFLPVSVEGSREAQWDRDTFEYLWSLAKITPNSGVQITAATLWNRDQDRNSNRDWATELQSQEPWFRDMMPEFRQLQKDELPNSFQNGVRFKTVCIDVDTYLNHLFKAVKDAGVTVIRCQLEHINEAAELHHSGEIADTIINCTGLMASKLGGVEDKDVYPARGQMCLVRAKMSGLFTTSGTDDGPTDTMYAMPRGSEYTVLGGSFEKNEWGPGIDPELSQRIVQRAARLCPEIQSGDNPKDLQVIKQTVGLRPMRAGGPRLEKECISGHWIIHNYGHGGFGYQASYGCALEVLKLLRTIDVEEKTVWFGRCVVC